MGQPFEGKSNDRRRIEAHPQLQKRRPFPFCLRKKLSIAFRRPIPGRVLYEKGVLTHVHLHFSAADGTARHQPRGNTAVLLHLCHRPDGRLVVVQSIMAPLGALKQPVIPLRFKQTSFVEARFGKRAIYIGRQDEILFVLHERI